METIQIGKIVGTHALKGELKVRSKGNLANECLVKGNFVFIQNKEYEITTVRVHKTNYLVSFKGYADINMVENLIGSFVFVDKKTIKIEENETLVSDLLKCHIYIEGKAIGQVERVIDNGKHDILVVMNDRKKIMIPYVDAFIESENIKEGMIVVKSIKGLIDEN